MKTLRSRGHRALLDVLIEARKKAALTQRELAGRLKRSKSYVDRIESGDQIPDPIECVAWAQACGITGWAFFWHFMMRLKRMP